MRRVVVTGMGVTSGIGNSVREFSASLQNQISGIGAVDTFDVSNYSVQLGSTVKGLEEKIPHGLRRKLPRAFQFLVNAMDEALDTSSVQKAYDPDRIGCYIAGPACSGFESENFYRDLRSKGLWQTNPYDLANSTWDAPVNFVSKRYNLRGPRNTILTACSSSGIAIGMAYDLVRLGEVDAIVAGGTDGFSQLTYTGFYSLHSIADEPCKPFDKNRAGLSFGEGAGILILEDYEKAVARNATIFAEIAGYGASSDGFNLTAPRPDSYGYISTMTKALKLGGVLPEQISYVNSHGTATVVNDKTEGNGINQIFKHEKIKVNSIKGLVGHCMGAAGAVEAIGSVVSILDDFIPGTKNCVTPDADIDVNILLETEQNKNEYVLCNSAGFGGNNSSVLFRRVVA